MRKSFLIVLFQLAFAVSVSAGDWRTWYEISGGTETPRYNATIDYCKKLADGSPMVHYLSFGKSARGRDLPLLVVDRDGLVNPSDIRSKGRTVLLIQACIHAGESEGKDAGLMLIRDLVIGRLSNGAHQPSDFGHKGEGSDLKRLLDKVSILFIPIFNADGHERFGPYNRINQNGPKEMGWRVQANNLNLNRDFLKAETPEMKAWLKLFNHWLPEFFVDVHTTDGADYQYVLTYLVETFGDMDEGLTQWASSDFIPQMRDHLMSSGFPSFPYVNFRSWHDPKSGLISSVAPPMLSQGYTALRNRPGLLIETHMLKPYNRRVEGVYECLKSVMEILGRQGEKLKNLEDLADRYLESGDYLKVPFTLQFETSMRDSSMVDFLGFRYDEVNSGISGGSWIRYSNEPVTFCIPYFSVSKPKVNVNLPLAYVIPVEWEDVIARLELHGVSVQRTKKDTSVQVQSWRLKNPKWQQNAYEGHHALASFDAEIFAETRSIPKGSAVVDLRQQSGRIIAHYLEPKGNGSMLYWGYFDAVLEQKEYAENYVLEQMAVKMLEKDPQLKKDFEAKKSSDTVFAASSQQILNWFYIRSPYADPRKGIYPVAAVTDPALLKALVK